MSLHLKQTCLLAMTISLIIVGVFIFVSLTADFFYENKFYPGVKLGEIKLTGLTKTQAEQLVKAKINEFNRTGQRFFWNGHDFFLYATAIASSDPDLSYDLVSFNLYTSLAQAFKVGRGQNFFDGLWQKLKIFCGAGHSVIGFEMREKEVDKILKENFSVFEKPGHNPQLTYDGEKISLSQEKLGLTFAYQKVIDKFKNQVAHLNFEPLELKLILDEPEFNVSQAEFLLPAVQEIINLAPLQISATTTEKNWAIEQPTLKFLVNLGWDEQNKHPKIIFDIVQLEKYLATFKDELYQPVKEAKFKLENNRVVEFQASQPGQEIDFLATQKNWEERIINQRQQTAEIILKTTQPTVTTNNVNQLGIEELVGKGQSNFAGSPVNRRHNIKIGAQSLNGLLVKPGEEFFLNAALGEINAAKGYLPELVIKGNETTPEYGGGLCQIGTTMFRLALNTGLPITERKPHAYRVVYYEPAGTDATIYPPHPDLRFINDTPTYLLLQTKIEGDNLIFEFFGQSDGRQTTTTPPRVYNITRPAETKYLETTELPAQKVKCIEIAHNGADTEFKRIINYANGEKKEEIWQSHYRPWQAVCLVGVEPGKTATSTSSTVPQ